ncbi:MAG: GT-D fold domain-containing glycosyltransferase, partial [Clostridium sp.]
KEKGKVKERFNNIKKIWENREIVIVEGEKSRLGVGNDLFINAKLIERIICPSINAFSKYSNILEAVKGQNKEKVILIALGPTATVLACDLAREGYQAIDIGHIDIEYEWFLQGVIEKCPVENKYIGEINGGSNVADITDENYEKQIICKVI